MKDLIERAEKATGPDREIDEALFAVLNGRPVSYGECQDGLPPRWTASLDAVVALVEREMPDLHGWLIGATLRNNDVWPEAEADLYSGPQTVMMTAQGKTPALALLLAFLRAQHGLPNQSKERG